MPPAYLKAPGVFEPPPTGCHAIERAWQRYGQRLKFDDLTAIATAVQNNHGRLVARLDDGLTSWLVKYHGVEYKLVISADFYTVITFLPPVPEKAPRRRKIIYKQGAAKWVSA